MGLKKKYYDCCYVEDINFPNMQDVFINIFYWEALTDIKQIFL